jgi:hypothetical protein
MPEDRPQHNRQPLERSKSLVERWPCEVKKCRNYGQLCYWTISDTADDHLPVTSIIMQHWLAAITRRECTVDVPPPEVIEQWQRQNLRALQDRVKRRERQAERKAARDPSSPRVIFYKYKREKESRSSSVKNPVRPTTRRPGQTASDSAGMSVG